MLRRRTVEKSGQKESRTHPNTMESTTRAGADYVRFSGCLWINGMGDTEMTDVKMTATELAHDNALRDFNARLHSIEVTLNNLNGAMASQSAAKQDRDWHLDSYSNRISQLEYRIIDLELKAHRHPGIVPFELDPRDAFLSSKSEDYAEGYKDGELMERYRARNKSSSQDVAPKRRKSKKGGAK